MDDNYFKKKQNKTESHQFLSPRLYCFSVRNNYPKSVRELLDRLRSTLLLSQGIAPCGHRVICVSQEAPSTESSGQLSELVNRTFSRTAPQAFCGYECPLQP